MRPQKQPQSALRHNKNLAIYPLQASDNTQINSIQICISFHLPVGA